MVQSLGQVMLYVRDLDANAAFWREQAGFERVEKIVRQMVALCMSWHLCRLRRCSLCCKIKQKLRRSIQNCISGRHRC